MKPCLKMFKSKVWLSCKFLVTIITIAKMCSAENASSYQYLRLPRQAPLRSKIHNHYPPPAIPPTPQSQLSRFPRPQDPVPWLLFFSCYTSLYQACPRGTFLELLFVVNKTNYHWVSRVLQNLRKSFFIC